MALTLAVCAPVSAQSKLPRLIPTPKPRVVKVDRTPPPLMPSETAWGLALNNPFIVPPAYDGLNAFFSIDGDRLVAYDLIAGSQLWTVSAHPLQQPAAGAGLIFLVEPDTLTARHISDGSVAWQIPFTEKLAVRPVWDNGWLIVASTGGEVGALRATDGELIWRRAITSPAHAAPALSADRVYIPTNDGRIVALRIETGLPVWERKLGGAANEILALNDRLYTGSLDNFFYCVMTADGRVDWRWRTGGDVIGMPIADEHYVYFVALDNVLRAMNLVTGGQQWMRPLQLRPAWGPVRAGSTIVVSGQQALRAFNVKDGVAVGTLTGVAAPPPEPEAATPAPATDTPATDTPAPKRAPQSFLALASDAEVAAVPHTVVHPSKRQPMLLLLFREIAKGASATLVVRSAEPVLIPTLAPLPNLIQIAPVAPTTPPRN